MTVTRVEFRPAEAEGLPTDGAPSPGSASAARLIIVTCADAGRLDLVLGAVERRIGSRADIAFAQPLTTRALPAGSGVVVSRGRFAELERLGAIRLAWRESARPIGYLNDLLERLEAGISIVAGAAPETEMEARDLWPDARIVRLEPGTETLRAGLSPRACLARSTAASTGPGRIGRLPHALATERVRDVGDIAAAIRDLSAAIVAHLPAPVIMPDLGPMPRPGAMRATNRPEAPRSGRPRQRRLAAGTSIGEPRRQATGAPPAADLIGTAADD